jgi:hypothetical protein
MEYLLPLLPHRTYKAIFHFYPDICKFSLPNYTRNIQSVILLYAAGVADTRAVNAHNMVASKEQVNKSDHSHNFCSSLTLKVARIIMLINNTL